MTAHHVRDIDLADATLFAGGTPQELFAELRDAGAVHRNPPTQLASGATVEFWSVVRHAEVQSANRDAETFSSKDGVSFGTDTTMSGHMLTSMDAPRHTAMRRLISAGFTPRMIGRLDDLIVDRTARILDEAGAAGDCDFVSDIAYQLPMHVIADIVGIEDGDRRWVFERVEKMIKASDPASGVTREDQANSQLELAEFAQRLTRDKRDHPADDIWTLITQAEVTVDGLAHRIDGLDLELFLVLLTIAGSETTRNALSQGLLALLDRPEQLAALRADDGLLPTAADEMIRWASPVLYFGRTATQDVELGGTHICEGDRVVLWYVSANRDERAFSDPQHFDISRSPNPHVSFGGGGPHYCLGANLAKREIEILTGALLRAFDVDVTAPVRWSEAGSASNIGVGVNRLPIRLTPRI